MYKNNDAAITTTSTTTRTTTAAAAAATTTTITTLPTSLYSHCCFYNFHGHTHRWYQSRVPLLLLLFSFYYYRTTLETAALKQWCFKLQRTVSRIQYA